MTTKIKAALLTTFLLFTLQTGLQAQDKYEYAIVGSEGSKVVVIKHSKEKFPIEKSIDDVEAAVIMKVEELVKEGWEVFNTTAFFSGNAVYHFFYLRKKP